MSILINGMKMPEEGFVELLISSDGTVQQTGQTIRIDGFDYYTPYTGETPKEAKAVELPPHGLIDKQMLLRNIADNQFAHSSVGHEDEYAFWGKVWDYINDAPTINEAEGETE